MKIKAVSIVALTWLLHSCSGSQSSKHENQFPGDWEYRQGNTLFTETWVRENDSTLLGRSFQIEGNDTSWSESITLLNTKDEILFIAKAEGQNNEQPVTFKMVSDDPHLFVFENKLHDFPTRITYHFKDNNNLEAMISGELNHQQDTVRFLFKRRHTK